MITPARALSLILDTINPLDKSEKVPLKNSLGRVVSGDIIAPLDLPPFDNSAVDGYAVNLEGSQKEQWEVSGEIKAGDRAGKLSSPEEAFRIFTGAPVPEGADTVIMQEKIENLSGSSVKTNAPVTFGTNIRPKGSQIEKGAVAVPKGTIISAATIGFLASLGLVDIEVSSKPSVSIIVTGNELVPPGEELHEGGIYESNSIMLEGGLKAAGIENIKILRAQDTPEALEEVVKTALKESDVVLLTGGISVGKYDLVKTSLLESGVKEVFYKIAQKPGKPMFYGTKGNIPVFALPGNPAAVLTCFYEYVYPALRKMSQCQEVFLPLVTLPLAQKVEKKPGLVNFLKGKITNEGVLPLKGQESYILKSFSEAGVIIVLEAESTVKEAGEKVEVHIIPFS